ncbi:MAG: hypothetical protein U1C97_03360, partial [Candidatus Gracilibacteria bacterium]|nr:hypothetical protein [Candidatus Gracilibacteria bacterium]
ITHFIQKGTRKTRTWYYLLGLLIAGSCHSLFNLLHHWEMSYLVVPLLIVLIVFLHFDEVHSQSRPLPSPALPPLRLKKASTH